MAAATASWSRSPKLNMWSTPEKNFGDVRLEADVIRLNGPEENRIGLVCRYQNGELLLLPDQQ